MENLKNIYTLGVTVLALILLVNTCTQEPCGDGEVIYSKTNIDSARTHHEHYVDSTDNWVKHSYSTVPEIVKGDVVTKYVFVDSHSREDDKAILNPSNDPGNEIDTFYYGTKDSSLRYNIRVFSEVKPDHIEMEYDILERTIRDSVYVRDSINVSTVEKVRVNQMYYGAEAVIYPNLSAVFAGVDFVSKKGWQAEVSGGLDLTNIAVPKPMVKVGFKVLFSTRKKKK